MQYHLPQYLPALLVPLVFATACSREEAPTEPAQTGGTTESDVSPQATTRSVQVDQLSVFWTSLVASPSGRKHIAYPRLDPVGDEADLKYATCGSNCTLAANWQKVVVDQGSRGSLKVGAAGRRHLVYSKDGAMKYATCATTNCTVAADWQKLTVDPGRVGGGGVGRFPSLAFGPNGGLHVSHEGDGGIKYSVCPTNCTSAASWRNVLVDGALFMHGATSIAVGPDGRRHISYLRHAYPDGNFAGDLRYATCLTNCTQAANWQKLTIDLSGPGYVGPWSSIAVGGDGRLHISYTHGSNSALKYATCSANCTVAANWRKVVIDNSGDVGYYTSIAVGSSGRLHISHFDNGNRDLRYATCLTNCTSAASWQRLALEQTGQVGEFTSLALAGTGGVVNVSYFDRAGFVKYLERSP